MKRIHRVIYQEIIGPGVIALGILTFVVFSREFGRLVETLIRKDAVPLTVLQVVLCLLPAILVYTFPLSFLIGVLVGFSRLSQESEIVAMRAAGIGIFQILRPVLKISLWVSLATLVLTMILLPAGNWKLKLVRNSVGARPLQSQLKPRVFNEDLPEKLLYVEDIQLGSGVWSGVFLADTEQTSDQIIVARRGQVLFGEDDRRVQLFFEDGTRYEFDPENTEKYGLSTFGTLDVSVEIPETAPLTGLRKRREDKSLSDILADSRGDDEEAWHRSLVELNRRLALPVAVWIFAVLGVTLGITSHRGGRGYGSIVSLVVAFSYYTIFAAGTELSEQQVLPILFGVWGGNLLLLVGAAISLRHARRGLRILSLLQRRGRSDGGVRGWILALQRQVERARRVLAGLLHGLRRRPGLRLRLARVIDLYVARIFLVNLAASLLVSAALFYLFTFFELVDDLFYNDIEYGLLLEYFFYLLPQVLVLLVPLSILIATLVTFGVLEKTAQLTAFKSCGISLYRVVIPVTFLVLLFSSLHYITQDYILPFANQRQDSLRSMIKGQPAQTFYQTDRSWIFGEGNRLYNYAYYDSSRRIFGELSIFELEVSQSQLRSHTYAHRAEWDPIRRQWQLFDGWKRDLTATAGGFQTFSNQLLLVPEKPDYFTRQVKESSKMTYVELQAYIGELRKGGFEVDHLLTELYKKVSFPIVSLVMALLGVPFAFTIGKKGALYGVAFGVFLGILYWGSFGVFGVLGSNGLLSPVLAAWGPNLVFGSAGSFLFLSVRT